MAPTYASEGNENASVWVEDDCKGYVVNCVHVKDVDEVIAILSQYKTRKRRNK